MDDEQNLVNEQSDEENLHRILQNSLTSFRDAFQVTCRSTGQPHNQCGQCKACRVDLKIHSAKDWWLQSTDLMRRRFLVALIHRSKPEILDQLGIILRPFVDGKGSNRKFCYFLCDWVHFNYNTNPRTNSFWSDHFLRLDYTYTRNKFDPNRTAISESMPNANEDNDLIKRHEDLTKFIVWFSQEDKYSQGSFILTILQWCDSELIFTIAFNVFSLQDMECKKKKADKKKNFLFSFRWNFSWRRRSSKWFEQFESIENVLSIELSIVELFAAENYWTSFKTTKNNVDKFISSEERCVFRFNSLRAERFGQWTTSTSETNSQVQRFHSATADLFGQIDSLDARQENFEQM